MTHRVGGQPGGMALDALDPDEVMALRFDEPAVAADLAAWSGGEVTRGVDDGDVVILVPGVEGARPARLGDWIVREPDGTHSVYSAQAFRARFEPTP